MTKKTSDIEEKLSQIVIPLPGLYLQTPGVEWQTLDDVYSQVELSNLFFKKASLDELSPLTKVVAARIACYETIEEKANHARVEYMRTHALLRKHSDNLSSELLEKFTQKLLLVQESERRLCREYSLLNDSYLKLQENVLVHCGESLIDMSLPRPQEAQVVLEHIASWYE